MEEIWKAIKDYDGYEVSNQGRVRSWWKPISRGIGNGSGSGGRVIGDNPKMLSIHLDSDGYCVTSATGNDGIHKSLRVHRLVAIAFIPNPNNYPIINHKNEIKTDNRVENLEWCTSEYNINYGTRNDRMALSKSKVVSRYDLQGNYVDSFVSSAEAHRQTGISCSHIVSACNGKRNQAGGYQWRQTESKENIAPMVNKVHESKNTKAINCYDDKHNFIKSYKSLTEASRDLGLRISDISAVLTGRQHISHGYYWSYA